MSDSSKPVSDRSVHIGGNVKSSVIQTGDHNVASLKYEKASLPPAESVDISSELAALREILTHLNTPDRRKIENALSDAKGELDRPKTDKDEVGRALDRALEYAKKAEGFAKVVETLKPTVTNIASWLGSNWYKILAAVGLTV